MAMIDKVLSKFLAPLVVAALASATMANAADSDQDPFESFNRGVFAFNDKADTYVIRPLAQGYHFITPQPVEQSINRAFANLLEVNSAVNSLLQAKFGKAAQHSGRFLLNSTIGVAGFLEVAEPMGLDRLEREDFGQTLGVWGVGPGPYLVLPFLGPSTVRDTPSRYVDSFLDPINSVDHIPTRNSIRGLDLLSTRAELLRADDLISGDPYVFTREVYLQRRDHLVNDGAGVDDFGDDYQSPYGGDAESEYDF